MIFDLRYKEIHRSGKILYIVFEIILIAYAILIILPLINMFISSFKNSREIFLTPYSLPETLRIENYIKVWGTGRFGRYFFNSVIVTGISISLTLLFGSMAAFGIARYRYKLSMLIFLVFLSGISWPKSNPTPPPYPRAPPP